MKEVFNIQVIDNNGKSLVDRDFMATESDAAARWQRHYNQAPTGATVVVVRVRPESEGGDQVLVSLVRR